MPKGFSEQEKEKIRARLLESGRKLFETYGVRKTSVEDLTQAVGISKGAFYIFYGSKEELFMDILEEIEPVIRDSLMKEAFQPGKSYRAGFKAFMKQALHTIEDYPLLKNMTGSEYNYLMRKLPEERLQAHLISDSQAVAHFIQAFGLEKVLTVTDPGLVANVIRALFFITLHKAEIGVDRYEETLDLLIEMVANYLIEE